MKILKYVLPIVAVVILYACKKNTVTVQPYDVYGTAANKGMLKIVYASAYTANPAVVLKLNGVAVSNGITGRTPFPGGGYNTAGSNYPLYLSVPLGDATFSISIVKVGTSVDSIVLYQTPINIPDNSPYTLHVTDTLVNATTNKTTSLLVKNLITPVPTGYCRYRFVNLIPNVATTNGAVDLYVNGVKILSNIAYKQASDTFSVATGKNSPGVTDPLNVPSPSWTVRPAGSATILATYANVTTMIDTKVYTIFSMGYVGATGTRLPFVSFTLDKND
jgi:hypothetical protein